MLSLLITIGIDMFISSRLEKGITKAKGRLWRWVCYCITVITAVRAGLGLIVV